MNALFAIPLMLFWHDLRHAWRYPGDMLGGAVFFVMMITLLPLGLGGGLGGELGGAQELLRLIAPTMLWIAVMLACLPQMDRLFHREATSGILEQMRISPAPMPLLMLAKIAAAWVVVVVPLVVVAPLLGVMLGLAVGQMVASTGLFALGGLGFVLVGAMAAALTLGAQGRGIFNAIIILPLAMPLLIFGAGATHALIAGDAVQGHVMLLTAFVLVLLVLAPLISAIAIGFAEE